MKCDLLHVQCCPMNCMCIVHAQGLHLKISHLAKLAHLQKCSVMCTIPATLNH